MAKGILSPLQRRVLTILSQDAVFVDKFYLTGGTALAEFYLKHRLSEDLDFFSEAEIDKFWLTGLSKKLLGAIPAKEIDRQESFNRNLVYFKTEDGVIKTEFTYFPFTQTEKPGMHAGVKVDSLTDIAVNKFFTIYQAPSARHFIDLYLLLTTKGFKWEELSKLARIKFDTAIDPLQLGSRLVQSETVSDLPKMIRPLPENRWRSYFMQMARELKNKL